MLLVAAELEVLGVVGLKLCGDPLTRKSFR